MLYLQLSVLKNLEPIRLILTLKNKKRIFTYMLTGHSELITEKTEIETVFWIRARTSMVMEKLPDIFFLHLPSHQKLKLFLTIKKQLFLGIVEPNFLLTLFQV